MTFLATLIVGEKAMHTLKALLLIGLIGSLSGCFTAKTVDNPEDERCNLVTKQRELHYDSDLTNSLGKGGDPRAMLPILVGSAPVSFIVSGSIVMVGNAVHWIEKTGKCSDKDVQKYSETKTKEAEAKGGKVVKSPKNFSDFLKNRKQEK